MSRFQPTDLLVTGKFHEYQQTAKELSSRLQSFVVPLAGITAARGELRDYEGGNIIPACVMSYKENVLSLFAPPDVSLSSPSLPRGLMLQFTDSTAALKRKSHL